MWNKTQVNIMFIQWLTVSVTVFGSAYDVLSYLTHPVYSKYHLRFGKKYVATAPNAESLPFTR